MGGQAMSWKEEVRARVIGDYKKNVPRDSGLALSTRPAAGGASVGPLKTFLWRALSPAQAQTSW